MLWLADRRLVCPAVRPPSWTYNQFFFSFSLKLSLNGCRFVVIGYPLWWEDGSVIYSCCSTVFLGSEIYRTRDQVLLYRIWDSAPPQIGGLVSCIPPLRNRVAQLYPEAVNYSKEHLFCSTYFFISMHSWKDVIACWCQDHGGIQLKSGSNDAAAVQQESDKKGTHGNSAPVRRLRLRGDWSDTGPDARPEREGGRRGGRNYYIFKNK
jgi:hypothetical protein